MKNIIKKSLLVWAGLMFMFNASTQTVTDGIKAIYYKKYKTAQSIFLPLVNANPADVQANYWLGQVALNQAQPDLELAKTIYTKAMLTTNKNPLIVVGLGHVALLQGDLQGSKAFFESALAATNNKKGGDPAILVAIGRANADGDSNTGDRLYAIEKLKTAAKLDPKNPEIYVLLGIEHLKGGIEAGGEAKRAFETALEIDPSYVVAKYRIARIFMGQRSKMFFMPLLEETVQADPAYGPAWLALYNYYAERDVNKAKEYIEKYIAVSDKDCETDLFYADYLFRAGKREDALAKATALEGTCTGDNMPNLYKLMSTIYDRMGDSIQARRYLLTYLSKQLPAKINATDYAVYANLLARFNGTETEVEEYMNKSFALDTSVELKLKNAAALGELYNKQNNLCVSAKWYSVASFLKPVLSASDYYYWGDAVTKCMNVQADTLVRRAMYVTADSIYQQYALNFPGQVQPFSFRANLGKLYDRDTSMGTALPAIYAYTSFLMKDSARNKAGIIRNYYYLIPYYAKLKSYDKALEAANAILLLEPTNEYALKVKQLLVRK
ncbi:MAG: hypothetical protein V4717_11470 [Bacteroidota bacterium]